ncbi:hypothetical protein CLAVI_000980, partial [Candidatus Clavichlamydia salmonicola]|uniref:hypothetical protein n=1 Tax=Candidatus Clavichlamydia salmonicola TaxID=469812 RepID=UPI001E518142
CFNANFLSDTGQRLPASRKELKANILNNLKAYKKVCALVVDGLLMWATRVVLAATMGGLGMSIMTRCSDKIFIPLNEENMAILTQIYAQDDLNQHIYNDTEAIWLRSLQKDTCVVCQNLMLTFGVGSVVVLGSIFMNIISKRKIEEGVEGRICSYKRLKNHQSLVIKEGLLAGGASVIGTGILVEMLLEFNREEPKIYEHEIFHGIQVATTLYFSSIFTQMLEFLFISVAKTDPKEKLDEEAVIVKDGEGQSEVLLVIEVESAV